MSNLTESELLRFAVENGIIDLDTIQQKAEMNERRKYLEMHPYEVWQGKNGSWYSYLPNAEKGRKLIKKSTEEKILNTIIKFWKENSEENVREKELRNMTLLTLFPKWLSYKWIHTKSSSYIKRITADWKRFYTKEVQLINKPIRKLEKVFLDEWAHNIIKKYDMTGKMYYNMSIILRQCLDYAVDIGCIQGNVFRDVKINTKLFRRVKKKTGATEVYLTDEQPKMIDDMVRRFRNDPSSTAPIAVMLLFEIGVRIGELCALKFEDIHGNYITIQRQEVRDFERVDDYTMKFSGFKIVEYTKSDDGFRDIYLTQTAKKLINLAEQMNIINNENNPDGFIFCKNGKNINHYSIQSMILRGCEAINIDVKTAHKIRKTFISTLIDSGVNIDRIRRMAGHSDERTTYGNYCYDRMLDDEAGNLMEAALNSQKVIKGNQFLGIEKDMQDLDFTRKIL